MYLIENLYDGRLKCIYEFKVTDLIKHVIFFTIKIFNLYPLSTSTVDMVHEKYCLFFVSNLIFNFITCIYNL